MVEKNTLKSAFSSERNVVLSLVPVQKKKLFQNLHYVKYKNEKQKPGH